MVSSRLSGKPFFAVCLLLSSLYSSDGLAQERVDPSCRPFANVAVDIKAVFDDPIVNSSHSFTSIQNMSSGSNVIPHYDAVALGLTRYNPVVEFRATLSKLPLPDGTTCAQIEKVEATVGYRNVTIFVANELTDDTCAFEHVLKHEQKHVKVNRDLLMSFVPYIRNKLSDYLSLYGTFRGGDADYAEEVLRERANFVLSQTSKNMVEENRRRQRLVDTPEEYAKNNSACGGRLNAIVRHTSVKRRK
jgi:hypothetical protein